MGERQIEIWHIDLRDALVHALGEATAPLGTALLTFRPIVTPSASPTMDRMTRKQTQHAEQL